jgi:hypothetical protein
VLTKPIKLEIGKRYYYWNKSVYDKSKGGFKECILRSLHGKIAIVERLDLTFNAKQPVNSTRLMEKREARSEQKNLL